MSNLISKAEEFATKAHEGHTEKDANKTPYIFHIQKVAHLVELSGGTPEEVAAAWLHDTVEDTPITFEDIKREFGPEVLEIVKGLTDLPEFESLPVAEHKQKQLERIKGESDSVKRVKIADQISAIELDSANALLDIEHRKKYVEGARKIVDACRGISPFLDQKFEGSYKSALELLS